MKSFISSRAKFAVLTIFTLAGALNLSADDAAAQFGFRGGFRGGFGRSSRGFRSGFGGSRSTGFRGVSRFGGSRFGGTSFGRSRFGGSRFGSFRRFGFRGFRGFGGSRFNSLAFRSRRFGSRGFSRSSRFRSFGVGSRRSFAGLNSRRGSFVVNRFPSQRFHSGFGSFRTFRTPLYSSRGLVLNGASSFVQPKIVHNSVGGLGWTQLVQRQPILARETFANQIETGQSPGVSRVGFALAEADSGNLDRATWAMRRALARNSDTVSSMMLKEELRPAVERVTRAYEDRMEASGRNADNTFMLAALYQMQGDPEMAAMAMDYAKKAGDFDIGAKNLKELISQQMSEVPMTTSAAWKLLAARDYKGARDGFIEEIEKDANAGVPKLGFALAAAAMGDLETGTWALKRAFEKDPERVSDVMLDGKVRPVVQTLIEQYERSTSDPASNSDVAITLAALYQLQGDVEAAEMMIKSMPEEPTTFLASMIKEEMMSTESIMKDSMKSDASEMMEEPVELTDYDLVAPTLPVIVNTEAAKIGVLPPLPTETEPASETAEFSTLPAVKEEPVEIIPLPTPPVEVPPANGYEILPQPGQAADTSGTGEG